MKQVTVLGFGPGNPDLLTRAAAAALEQADIIIGAPRLLPSLSGTCKGQRAEAVRADQIRDILRQGGWQTACVILSGDTGLYSGAKALWKELEKDYAVRTIPGVSSLQYLAAKLNRPWQDWRIVSAHGVACDAAAEVRRGGAVFFFTGGVNSAALLCARLRGAGLGETRVTIGERLSYPGERIVAGTAAMLAEQEFDGLSVLLAEYSPRQSWPYANTGLPDECFVRGGVPMTKQEVRAAALAKLRVAPDDVVYDIGAGTGSVSVELALLASRGQVYAVERDQEARRLILTNREAFGLGNLHFVEGSAPDALGDLPKPDAAFIGGSGGGLVQIIKALKEKNPVVRICVACITVETLSAAVEQLDTGGFQQAEVCQIAVSRSQLVGGLHMMKALNPVYLVSTQGVER